MGVVPFYRSTFAFFRACLGGPVGEGRSIFILYDSFTFVFLGSFWLSSSFLVMGVIALGCSIL